MRLPDYSRRSRIRQTLAFLETTYVFHIFQPSGIDIIMQRPGNDWQPCVLRPASLLHCYEGREVTKVCGRKITWGSE